MQLLKSVTISRGLDCGFFNNLDWSFVLKGSTR